MKSLYLNLLEENLYSYSGALGVDYWEHKYFYLSSEIGYTKRGGKQQLQVLDSITNPIGKEYKSEVIKYLHFNTTFRFRYSINRLYFFVGVGPTIDILLGEQTFTPLGNVYNLKRTILGVKPEVGCTFQIGKKINLGFNASRLLNIEELGRGGYLDTKINGQTTLLMLSIGYRL